MIGAQVTVTTTAAVIADAGRTGTAGYPRSFLIKNPSGGQTVFIGGSNVDTANNAYKLEAGDVISVDLVNNQIWGVVAATTQAISVFTREG